MRRSHNVQEAERLLRLGLEHLALEGSALEGLKRSDPRKIAIAWVIRARTTVANEWIARELALGHVTSRYCSDRFKHHDLPGFTVWPSAFAFARSPRHRRPVRLEV